MSSARLLFGLASVSLALGCAAQREEAPMASSEAERAVHEDAELMPEATATEPASEQQGERSLEDIQRELAANEAKLRALGVELSGAAGPSRADAGDGATATTTKERERGEVEKDKGGIGAGGGQAGQSRTQPGAPGGGAVRPKLEDEPRAKPGKQNRKSKKNGSKDLDIADDGVARPSPDEAKAVPLSPGEEPQQDAVGRCEQICDLGAVTCELNEQICELAERHPDEDDYHAACERAAEDCEAAQEACDDCAG